MSTFRFAVIVAIMMTFSGIGAFIFMSPNVLKTFDYETASKQERTAYLQRKANLVKRRFKPNFLSKNVYYGATGDTIQLTYNTGMASLTCGTEIDCRVSQCQKYLRHSISDKDVQVRIKYRDNSGRSIGSQTLKTASCTTLVKRWDAGADKRKKESARKKKARCSDDYVGMKPIDCRL